MGPNASTSVGLTRSVSRNNVRHSLYCTGTAVVACRAGWLPESVIVGTAAIMAFGPWATKSDPKVATRQSEDKASRVRMTGVRNTSDWLSLSFGRLARFPFMTPLKYASSVPARHSILTRHYQPDCSTKTPNPASNRPFSAILRLAQRHDQHRPPQPKVNLPHKSTPNPDRQSGRQRVPDAFAGPAAARSCFSVILAR